VSPEDEADEHMRRALEDDSDERFQDAASRHQAQEAFERFVRNSRRRIDRTHGRLG